MDCPLEVSESSKERRVIAKQCDYLNKRALLERKAVINFILKDKMGRL